MHQGIIIYIMNILKYYKIYLKHKFHISFYLKIFQSINSINFRVTKIENDLSPSCRYTLLTYLK